MPVVVFLARICVGVSRRWACCNPHPPTTPLTCPWGRPNPLETPTESPPPNFAWIITTPPWKSFIDFPPGIRRGVGVQHAHQKRDGGRQWRRISIPRRFPPPKFLLRGRRGRWKMSETFLCVFPRVKRRTPTAPADKVQGLTGNQTSKMSLVARSFPLSVRSSSCPPPLCGVAQSWKSGARGGGKL